MRVVPKNPITAPNYAIIMGTEYSNAGAMLEASPGATSKGESPMPHHSIPSPEKIPYGYCACGCGQKTKIATKSNRARGVRKGQPLKIVQGHQGRRPIVGQDRFHDDGTVSVAMASRDSVARYALIDQQDYDLVKQYRWHSSTRREGKVYAQASVTEDGSRSHIYLHRLLMDAPAGVHIDHINGDTLDCRRANIRRATPAQNVHNASAHKDAALPYKGVSPTPHGFGVSIYKSGRSWWLGRHDDLVFAARIYDAAAVDLFGEFANLNFPDEDIDPEAKKVWEWYRAGNKRQAGAPSHKKNRASKARRDAS